MIRPIILILASFIIGILLNAFLADTHIITKSTLLIALFIFLILALIASIKHHFSARFFIYPCFFLLGALFILPNLSPQFKDNHITSFADKEMGPFGGSFEGVLLKAPEISNGQRRLYIDITKYYPPKDKPIDLYGRVRLSVPTTGNKSDQDTLLRGDTLRFLAKLARPRNFNNPGGFDYEWWLARKAIFVTGRVSKPDFIVKTLEGKPGLMRTMDITRNRVNDFLDDFNLNSSPANHVAIIKALVTGERSAIDPEIREAFIKTGTAHILAISGLHIGIVAYFSFLVFFNIFRLFERLSLAINIRKLSWILALIPVGFYGLLAGFPVSTQRAIIMVSTFVFAYLLERSRDLYATLALAALIVLLLHPGSLWDASFQFSFSAVFAIFYLVSKFDKIFSKTDEGEIIKVPNKKIAWLTRKVRFLIFITAAASLATIPLSIYHFNNLPLSGIALNLIVVPIVSLIIVPLSLISVIILPVSETLSTLLLSINEIFIAPLVLFIKSASNLEWSHLKISTITLIELASFYLILFILFEFKKRRYLLYLLPLLIIGLTLPGASNYYQRNTNDELRVTFLNVGQGEASFIEFPGGKTMLIDAGGAYRSGFDMGEMVVSPFLRGKRIRKIDYLVMSHAQLDHKGGLAFIADSFDIGEFWWSGRGKIPALTKALDAFGTPGVIKNSASEPLDINGVKVLILNPAPMKAAELSLNEGSLVIKLTYGNSSILFTGDIGEQAETLLLKSEYLNANILKAPHHGSRYSSSTPFLDYVAPAFVVISAGHNNSYAFPHKEALRRYDNKKAKVFRTDLHGAVLATVGKEKIEIKGYAKGL